MNFEIGQRVRILQSRGPVDLVGRLGTVRSVYQDWHGVCLDGADADTQTCFPGYALEAA